MLATLQTLALITSVLAIVAWCLFVRFYRSYGPGRNRYLMMFIWITLATTWWVVNAIQRLFFGYSTPTVTMSLAKTVIEVYGFIGAGIIFYLRWRGRRLR